MCARATAWLRFLVIVVYTCTHSPLTPHLPGAARVIRRRAPLLAEDGVGRGGRDGEPLGVEGERGDAETGGHHLREGEGEGVKADRAQYPAEHAATAVNDLDSDRLRPGLGDLRLLGVGEAGDARGDLHGVRPGLREGDPGAAEAARGRERAERDERRRADVVDPGVRAARVPADVQAVDRRVD